MALFSRRPKKSDATSDAKSDAKAPSDRPDAGDRPDTAERPGASDRPGEVDPAEAATEATGEAIPASGSTAGTGTPADTGTTGTTADTGTTDVSAGDAAEAVPQVNISLSTYGKPATPAPRPRPAAEAPPRSETVPGLPDNAVVKQALAALPDKPGNTDVLHVMRQTLQGHLYVRVRGDARAQLAEGKPLTLAVSAVEGKKFLLAFTGGEALQASIRADGDTATSALGQPVLNVLRNVSEGQYAGLILDHAVTGARLILPEPLIKKALEEGDPNLTLKNLLCAPRTDATAAQVVDALTQVTVWVAAGKPEGSDRFGLAEARTERGERFLEVFSHPLEVLATGRGDRPLPLTPDQLAKAVAGEGLDGVVVDPPGPWIQLDRAQLAPLLSLAP